MRRLYAILFFISAFSPVALSQPRFILQNGHSGAVTVLAYQQENNVLLSGGKDGVVAVWDINTQQHIYRQRVSNGSVQLFCVHPQKPYYAVAAPNAGNYSIVVGDWQNNKIIFSLAVKDKPLFLAYSPLGKYLVVCVENWRSLYLFDAETGRMLDNFTSGFGIV